MAVYVITGTLGSGKSLVTMGKMREYLWANKRVATNVNVQVENLVSGKAPRNIVRVPDHPTAEFLWDTLGMGSENKNEATFGMLCMDEVGTWLNSREWKGNDRQRVIEFFVHSRKRRWDCYLIAQSLNMIDKQVRESIAEHVVLCSRADRLSVPFIGWIVEQLGMAIRLPQIHMAKVYYTAGRSMAQATKVTTWVYNGRDLWGSYDTGQRFAQSPLGAGETAERRDMSVPYGYASYLDPHKYTWLKKPQSVALSFIETCRQRGWQRLETLADMFHTMTPDERGYRLLQLWEAHGNALVKPMPRSFDEWAAGWKAWDACRWENEKLFG